MFKLFPYLRIGILNFIFTLITALGVVYLFSPNFRQIIKSYEIDANIIVAIATFSAVFFSIKEGVQNRNFTHDQGKIERNFNYKLAVSTRLQEMGIIVIGELLEIEKRRYLYVQTLKNIKMCMEAKEVYIDANNITDLHWSEPKAAAAIDMYFPAVGDKWNEIMETMSSMGTIASSLLLTYRENDYGNKETFKLKNINYYISEIEKLNEEIAKKPQEIRDEIKTEINKWQQKFSTTGS